MYCESHEEKTTKKVEKVAGLINIEPTVSLEAEIPKFSNHVMIKWDQETIILDFLSLDPDLMFKTLKNKGNVIKAPIISRIAIPPKAAIRMVKHITTNINKYLSDEEIEEETKDIKEG